MNQRLFELAGLPQPGRQVGVSIPQAGIGRPGVPTDRQHPVGGVHGLPIMSDPGGRIAMVARPISYCDLGVHHVSQGIDVECVHG